MALEGWTGMASDSFGDVEPASVSVRRIVGRGFDGIDTAVNVITILVSGVGGGMVAAIGETAWEKVRGLVQRFRTRDHASERAIVVVVSNTNGRMSQFECEAQDLEALERFVQALAVVESRSFPPGVVSYDSDSDTWELGESGSA